MVNIIDIVEKKLQAMLDSGEIECPAEDCASEQFNIDIQRDTESGFVGNITCRDCDQQIDLDLDDDPVERAEATLDALQAQNEPEPASSVSLSGAD